MPLFLNLEGREVGMQQKVISISIEEVREFVRRKNDRYRDLVNDLKKDFIRLAREPSFKNKIYRVYSRGDITRVEFKNDWAIWCKVNNIRNGEGRDAEGKRRKPQPGFNIEDLWDIVGLTIVCIFPSDVIEVQSFISEKIKGSYYKEHKNLSEGELKKFKGYHALHYVLRKNDSNFPPIWCEVQIKSILCDAWTWKTHDVTYKPQGEIDKAFRRQMSIIGEQLQALDEQSEIVKNIVLQDWQDDKRRRYAACLVHATRLRQDQSNTGSFLDLISRIEKCITEGNIEKEEVDEITKDALEICKTANHEISARIKLMVSLAFEKISPDEAIYEIKKWINKAESKIDEKRALLVQAMTFFLFHQVEEAIENAESVLKSEGDIPLSIKTRTFANLAYYYSYIMHSKLGEEINARKKAEYYIEKANETISSIEEEKDRKRMAVRLKDTEGYNLITQSLQVDDEFKRRVSIF